MKVFTVSDLYFFLVTIWSILELGMMFQIKHHIEQKKSQEITHFSLNWNLLKLDLKFKSLPKIIFAVPGILTEQWMIMITYVLWFLILSYKNQEETDKNKALLFLKLRYAGSFVLLIFSVINHFHLHFSVTG